MHTTEELLASTPTRVLASSTTTLEYLVVDLKNGKMTVNRL